LDILLIIIVIKEKGNFLTSKYSQLQIHIFIHNNTSQPKIAKQSSYNVGSKVNFIIKALIKKGLVKVENFITNEYKYRYRYFLTPAGIEEKIMLTQKFLEWKRKEYEELQGELEKMKKKKLCKH